MCRSANVAIRSFGCRLVNSVQNIDPLMATSGSAPHRDRFRQADLQV
jgi:hypothetical protein